MSSTIGSKDARDLGWKPRQELLDEIHDGDVYLRRYWPCQYGGLEPLDKRRGDWRIRYEAVFQLVSGATTPRPRTRQKSEFREAQGLMERVAAFSKGDDRPDE